MAPGDDGSNTERPTWGSLPTERRLDASRSLDTLTTVRVVALLLTEDRRGLELAAQRAAVIAQAAEWVAEALARGGDVVFVGAGTSGRLGVLEAAECPPTFGTEPRRIRAMIAGGEEAVFRAREGAEDRADEGRAAAAQLGAEDLVLGISASSLTPFVRGALDEAHRRGSRTVLLTCAAADGLDKVADLLIALDTGAEVLTGSTRLKAGSATKAALNAITTAAMVRLGKTYGNLMVDLRPGSAKLEDRARRILEEAGGVSTDVAQRLLVEASGELKTAIVMAIGRLSADQARRRLAAAGGRVRQAIDTPPPRP